MAQSFDQTMSNLVAGATGSMGAVDTRVGTVLRDGILAPVALEFTNAYSEMDVVSANQGINTAALQSDTSLENLGSNHGVSRSIGSYATTTVRLFRYAQPTANIPIPKGTKCWTELSSSKVSFSTQATVYLTPTSPTADGAYYVDCAVMCDQAGSVGQVVAGGISYVQVVGVDGVTNLYDTTGGVDAQTNEELVATIKSTARGNSGTRPGYESLVRNNFAVADVSIITGRDSDATRSQYGGSTDIIVLDETRAPMTESFIFVDAATTTQLSPTFLPLTSVTQIMGKNDVNEDVALLAGTDYEVVYDTFSINRRSVSEKSKIVLHISSFTPLDGSLLTVEYMYSPLIANIQNFLDEQDYHVFGSDVMVKLGIVVPANVTANIRVFPGYNATSVRLAVEDAVSSHFAALLLDDDVQASDVISVISNVAGVDSVDLNTFSLARASQPAIALQEIAVNRQQYIRLNTATISVIG